MLAVLALDLVGSARGLAIILGAQAIARVLMSPVGGYAVDRLRAESVLRVVGILNGIAWASLAAVKASARLEGTHLLVYAVGYGTVSAFTMPAIESLVPSFLPAHLVRRGNALRSFAINTGRLLAPPLVALLISYSAAAAPAICGALFVGSSVMFRRLRSTQHRHPARIPIVEQIRDSVLVASRQPLVGGPIAMLVVFSVGYTAAAFVGVPVLAKAELGGAANGLGILLGAVGAGSLLGSVAMITAPKPARPGLLASAAVATIGLGLLGVGFVPSMWLAAACLGIAGVGTACAAVSLLTLVQSHTPSELRGRVMALWSLGLTGLTPAASAIGGVLAEALGARGLLLLNGLCVIAAAGVGLGCAQMRRVCSWR